MRLNYRTMVTLYRLKMWWQMTKIFAMWKVLVSRRHWIILDDGKDEPLMIISRGWKTGNARQIVKAIHKRVMFDNTTAAHEAQDIIDQK